MARTYFLVLTAGFLLSACASAPPYYQPVSAHAPRDGEHKPGTEDFDGSWSSVYGDLLGIPYRYGGASTRGFDCSGLVQYVYARRDRRQLPRTVVGLFRMGDHVRRSDLQPGDLVFYETNGRGPSHVGIYIGEARFLHASRSHGVEITALHEEYYAGRYLGARRL